MFVSFDRLDPALVPLHVGAALPTEVPIGVHGSYIAVVVVQMVTVASLVNISSRICFTITESYLSM